MTIGFLILTILYGEKNKTSIVFLFVAISAICFFISNKILLFEKSWRKIKTKECNCDEKKE